MPRPTGLLLRVGPRTAAPRPRAVSASSSAAWGRRATHAEALAASVSRAPPLPLLLLPLERAVRRRAAACARDELAARRAQQPRRFPACLALSVAAQTPTSESRMQRLRRWLRLALHLCKQLGLGLPLVAAKLLIEAVRALASPALAEALDRRWLELAYGAARRSSPVVMKFLQWASTRRDIFSPAFCDRFETFHEHAPAHSWAATEVALRDALGDDWAAIVAIDTHAPPIGSGCIAQVYRGTLRATGERVAVKVIHPQVKELVAFDLELMRLAVRAMEAVPRLQLLGGRESVDEFAAIMGRQLDLRAEAENLLRFKRHFRGRRGALGFPTPHLEHTTESVLVESFEDGMHFSEMCAQLDAPRRKAAARVLLESFLRMVFLDNFAHGDLHPGNLLFAAAPQCDVQDQVPRHTNALLSLFGEARQEHKHEAAPVVAVDAGIVTRLEPEDLRNFVELFHAVATGDGHKAGELIVARSKPTRPIAPAGEKQRLDTPADGAKMAVSEQMTAKCTDVEAFCAGMEAIVNEALRWRLSLRKVHVGALLREVMELCCAHEVKLEGKYASIVVSIAVLEAVGRKLDPDIDLLAVAMPIIAQSLVQNVLTA